MIKKHILQRLILLLLMSIPMYANIDARIDEIKKAPIEERFKLMNAFKKDVIKMQNQERINAITKLKEITNSPHSKKVLSELHSHTKPNNLKTERSSKSGKKIEVRNQQKDKIKNHIENETEEHAENDIENHIEGHIENDIGDEHNDDD